MPGQQEKNNRFGLMKWFKSRDTGNPSVSVYELLVWLIYVCIYKYDLFARSAYLPRLYVNFPFPQLILYSLATTLYVLPFYRLIAPWFLRRRRYVLLFVTTLVYFIVFSKYLNWGVSYLFLHFNTDPAMTRFYRMEFWWYNITARSRGTRIPEMLIDMLVFYSVLFLRWATENERKKYALEKDNLMLQLETLKAQLHPHFLFNTLNSIYGMSLTGAKETPAFILRLSDMMRYVLYECKGNQVPLEKDIHFLSNYLEMEKKRYPQADIQFDIDGPFDGTVAPLLLIPFVENSFKHGAHRVVDSAFIRGEVRVSGAVGADEAGMGRGTELIFHLRNSVLPVTPQQKTPYGGVGIENVRKRLALYYPGRFDLQINTDDAIYSVDLKIQLT